MVQSMSWICGSLSMNVEGRLDLEQLCSAVRLNPDYFRKQFKELAGMSPSRYQGWQRVLGLLKQICDMYARGELPPRVTIPTQVVDAGFYDVSHASRTLARYFGVVPQMLPRFVDCR